MFLVGKFPRSLADMSSNITIRSTGFSEFGTDVLPECDFAVLYCESVTAELLSQ